MTVDAETFTITVTGAARATGGTAAWHLADVTPSGPSVLSRGAAEPGVSAYPNPLRERATIRFALAEAGPVRLTVFDVEPSGASRLSPK